MTVVSIVTPQNDSGDWTGEDLPEMEDPLMIRNSSHSLVLTVQVQVYLPWGNEYLPIKGAEIIYLDYIFDHHFLMVLR